MRKCDTEGIRPHYIADDGCADVRGDAAAEDVAVGLLGLLERSVFAIITFMNLKLSLVVLCGTFAAVAFGNTIYVSPEGAGNKDGTSPDNAYAGLFCVMGKNQTCKASEGDTIKLLPGTYTETPVSSELYALKGLKDVIVEGDTANPANVVFDGKGSSVRFFGLGSQAGLTVRGATFKNTNSGNNYEAFYVSDSTLHLEDCVFSAITNTAANGAALYLADHDSIAEIRRCSFTDCASTTGSGGAIARKEGTSNIYRVYDCGFTNCCAVNAGALQGPGVVDGCSFSNCQKIGTSSNGGGAIWSDRTDYEIEIRGCTFIDCLSYKPGGALWLPACAHVTDCTFENCVSTGESGGAAYGGVAYTNCVFRNCTSGVSKPGGALYLTATGAEVIDCTFENCMTSGSNPKSGAIYSNSSLTMKGGVVDNCGVNNPSGTPYGSAVYVSGSATIEDIEFKNCTASGGLLCLNTSGSITRCQFHDCSVADGSSGCAIRLRGGTVSVAGCSFVALTASRGAGIQTAADLTKLDVRDCLFAGCVSTTGNGGAAMEVGATTFNVDNCTFANCRITGNSNDYADPLEATKSGGTLTANNCIFWGNWRTVGTPQLRSVYVRAGSGTLSHSAYDGMRSSNTPTISECEVIAACPFVQDGSWEGDVFTPGDYTLAKKVADGQGGRIDNPCLGAGVKLDWMTADTKDLAGNPRLRENELVDLGCYEYFQQVTGFSVFVR